VILAPLYAWFTEGFDARELIEAKARLEELRWRSGSSNGPRSANRSM